MDALGPQAVARQLHAGHGHGQVDVRPLRPEVLVGEHLEVWRDEVLQDAKSQQWVHVHQFFMCCYY